MAEEKTKEIKITIPVPEELFSLFLPGLAYEHLLKAKKETLLAIRVLIDSKIAVLEKKEAKKAAPKKKIKIE